MKDRQAVKVLKEVANYMNSPEGSFLYCDLMDADFYASYAKTPLIQLFNLKRKPDLENGTVTFQVGMLYVDQTPFSYSLEDEQEVVFRMQELSSSILAVLHQAVDVSSVDHLAVWKRMYHQNLTGYRTTFILTFSGCDGEEEIERILSYLMP